MPRLYSFTFLFSLFIFAVSLLLVSSTPLYGPEMSQPQYYRAIWNLNSKRSPSIGLSLAEYMAHNQGQDQSLHFIPTV
ncbi:unnamed protein product [Meloidogyne enterolobii]|uniref:Uncharacterized protein n=1 Tax=Meloidogyne enterolobii TaxID=390850 RepID=A0ACB0ZXB4_MELEN